MKRILTLATLVFATSCFGQEDCELSYDGNGDGIVSAADLIGLLAEFGSECLPDTTFDCGETLEYQGYEYATVLVGEQCWFAENLRAGSYSNGETISTNLTDEEWSNTVQGACSVFGSAGSVCNSYEVDGVDACVSNENLEAYGQLYNWHAVADERGLCPVNWHVPTELDWQDLELELGMDPSELELIAWRGTDQGIQIKSQQGWFSEGFGTNSSGFTGEPGGRRRGDTGEFDTAGYSGWWWTSSEASDSTAYWRYVDALHDRIWRQQLHNRNGMSIRCIKDSE